MSTKFPDTKQVTMLLVDDDVDVDVMGIERALKKTQDRQSCAART